VGIRLESLEEGYCEYLNLIDTLNLDQYKKDKSMSSVDHILNCNDKYIFIEEKSFLLDYFRLAGKKKEVENFIPKNGIISDQFLESISSLDNEIKKQLLYQAVNNHTLGSVDKVKDTTIMLCNDDSFCNEKIKKAKTIYLYCKSGTHLDRLFALIYNSKKQKEKYYLVIT